MKVLIVGNSNVGTLIRGYKEYNFTDMIDFTFYSVPGGTGPALRFEGELLKLIPGSENAKYRAYSYPIDSYLGDYQSYDAILVSALGYICGGYGYDKSILSRNYSINDQLKEGVDLRFVSLEEQKFIFWEFLNKQHGFIFLKDLLVSDYKGKVFVQKFPNLSESCLDNNSWKPSQLIENIGDTYGRYLAWLDEYFELYSKYGDFTILYASSVNYIKKFFTPRHLMEVDGSHGNFEYGRIILEDFICRLTACEKT